MRGNFLKNDLVCSVGSHFEINQSIFFPGILDLQILTSARAFIPKTNIRGLNNFLGPIISPVVYPFAAISQERTSWPVTAMCTTLLSLS